jgi:hypothetical protein
VAMAVRITRRVRVFNRDHGAGQLGEG